MSSVPYPNPQAIFYQQYESVRRDEVVGILLALFLGTFGIHHFYLRRTRPGMKKHSIKPRMAVRPVQKKQQ
jgi:sterol desaturase/sphingolipid hydroxylase (fatty acid hydroxylase superfamily)